MSRSPSLKMPLLSLLTLLSGGDARGIVRALKTLKKVLDAESVSLQRQLRDEDDDENDDDDTRDDDEDDDDEKDDDQDSSSDEDDDDDDSSSSSSSSSSSDESDDGEKDGAATRSSKKDVAESWKSDTAKYNVPFVGTKTMSFSQSSCAPTRWGLADVLVSSPTLVEVLGPDLFPASALHSKTLSKTKALRKMSVKISAMHFDALASLIDVTRHWVAFLCREGVGGQRDDQFLRGAAPALLLSLPSFLPNLKRSVSKTNLRSVLQCSLPSMSSSSSSSSSGSSKSTVNRRLSVAGLGVLRSVITLFGLPPSPSSQASSQASSASPPPALRRLLPTSCSRPSFPAMPPTATYRRASSSPCFRRRRLRPRAARRRTPSVRDRTPHPQVYEPF